MRSVKKFCFLFFLVMVLSALYTAGSNAYTYPDMPASASGITVRIGTSSSSVTLPLAAYEDGAYWSPEKRYMTRAEASQYGLSLKSDLYLKGSQCCGFARYVYAACFYRYSKDAVMDTYIAYAPNPDGSKYYTELGTLSAGYTASQAKALLTQAVPGSVLRISGHSMVLMAIFDDGVVIYDANYSSSNEVDVRSYTWEQLSKKLGYRGIQVLNSPVYFPGYTYYYFGQKYDGSSALNVDTSCAGTYLTCNYSGSRTSRSGPGSSYSTSQKISADSIVNVYGSCNGWYAVKLNGSFCWLPCEYLKAYNHQATVTFDADGGTVDVTTQDYEIGKAFGELPVPEKDSRTFAGWYCGNEKYTEDTIVPEETAITLTAHWYIYEFTDVPEGSWYADYVEQGVNYGLIVHDTTFRPADQTSRAEFVTVLGRQYQRMTGKTITASAPAGYTDVKKNSYYASFAGWAVSTGIVKGTSSTTFSPGDPITREQIATMLYRFVLCYELDSKYTGSSRLGAFPDGRKVSSYATEAMNWAVRIGLFQGDDNGYLNPTASATRAEMVTIFDRFLEKYSL